MATRDELISNIRAKYPQYQDMSDDALAEGFAKKYPVYAQELAANPKEAAQVGISQKTATMAPLQGQAGQANLGADLTNIISALPLVGARNALKEGYATGQEALGQGWLGKSLGALIGGTQALGTAFNPITKGLGYIPNVAEAIGGAAALEPTQARNSLLGGAPVQSAINPAMTESTTANFLSDLISQAAHDPANAGFLAAGLTAPRAVGAVKEVPAMATTAVKAPVTVPLNVISQLSKVSERMQPATVSQSAEAAFGFTKPEVAEHIPVIRQRVLEQTGNIPKTAEEALAAMDNTKEQLYNERKDINYAAEQQGLTTKGDIAVQAAKAVLDPLKTIDDAQKSSIISRLEKLYGGDQSITEGQNIQEQLNNKFSAAYENGTIDRADPAFQAEKAIRDSFANQMDDISRIITGKVETPYSDIGSLIESRAALSDKLDALYKTHANQKTGINTPPSKIPTTTYQAKYQFLKSSKNPLVKTQIEKLNDNVKRVFEESPSQPPPFPIEEAIRQSLQSQAQPSPVSAINAAAGVNPDYITALRQLGVSPDTAQGQAILRGLQQSNRP